MNNCSMPQATFEFTKDEINQAVKDNRLLSVELEFSLRCNLRCQYCYIPDKNNFENDLTQGELREVILQVKELGARKIIILGGEPMLYPQIMEMITFITLTIQI